MLLRGIKIYSYYMKPEVVMEDYKPPFFTEVSSTLQAVALKLVY